MAGKRIAVVGTGASGASVGVDLTRAGLDVSLIEQWPEHVEAMRANGVRTEMPEHTLTTPVVYTTFAKRPVCASRSTSL